MRGVFGRVRRLNVRAVLFTMVRTSVVVSAMGGSLAQAATADRRVALVIGNGAYENVAQLDNPLTDSKAVAAALKRIGFDVVEGYDLKLDGMRSLVGQYAAKLDGAKVAFVYYAGHGVAVAGDNYLLPTDTVLKSEADLDFKTMNVNLVLRQMQREDRVNVVILDACRDNPFTKELARSLKTRSASVASGLSEITVNSAAGTMIAFATDPGKTALDGAGGQNSPFTTALLKHMETPGVSISTVMDRVREDVWRSTGERQRPWVNTSIIGEFYLNPTPAAAALQVAAAETPGVSSATPAMAAAGPQALEIRLWESAEKSGAKEDYQAYLDAHPNGYFAQIARNRLARLNGQAGGRSVQSEAELKEPGTAQTEAGLALSVKDRIEAQQRLRAIGFDPGGTSGTFGPGTRRALSNWQKTKGLPDSGFMTKAQQVALWEQSEPDYQKAMARPQAERAVRATAPRAQRPAPAQTRAMREPAPYPQQQPQRGPSLGEMGNFLGGVGNLVGSMRR
ncbi:caspase family protein [Methylobacterium gnaphalii]|uniref:Peptidase n=1 Tax=Methylobacterium gnaphalii TaxID=1010610 RepID=A0A512JHR8_9HYPH|nr:caspase family protein [Methylobacterium gnaphalii]GEP09500.1 peptidase [Methylobacterium gnaphalii]GJD70269.1 hypothetical protein MMMDOFMJ_3214 [Methylobacterium gnaphalii]GLS51726.1 peptidase [Methylobacterium gnaphalii]